MLFFETNIWYFKELQLLEGDNIDDQSKHLHNGKYF